MLKIMIIFVWAWLTLFKLHHCFLNYIFDFSLFLLVYVNFIRASGTGPKSILCGVIAGHKLGPRCCWVPPHFLV